MRILREGSVALRVGEYMAERRVYLAGGMPMILEDRELEHAK